jgi:AP-2 complex subunit alpha
MICHMSSEHWNPDVQQRGVEFLALFGLEAGIQSRVIATNPVFTEEQQQSNPLLKKFSKGAKKGK